MRPNPELEGLLLQTVRLSEKTVTETVTMKRFHFLLLALACCDARPLIRMIRDQREFDKVRDRRAAGKSLDG